MDGLGCGIGLASGMSLAKPASARLGSAWHYDMVFIRPFLLLEAIFFHSEFGPGVSHQVIAVHQSPLCKYSPQHNTTTDLRIKYTKPTSSKHLFLNHSQSNLFYDTEPAPGNPHTVPPHRVASVFRPQHPCYPSLSRPLTRSNLSSDSRWCRDHPLLRGRYSQKR